MTIDRIQMGQNVVRLRKAAGLTQQRLADQLGVSNAAISQIETAVCMPSLTAIAEIADVLGVTVADLLDEGNSALLARVVAAQREITKALAEVAALGQLLAAQSHRLEDILDRRTA